MEFSRVVKHAKILSPLKNFEEEQITFEYRADPLTGRNTTVIKGMLNYVDRFLKSDAQLVADLAQKTKATCPFCPESVRSKTPMFTKNFLAEGRIVQGEATVIPNLLGHAEQSILAILSRAHSLELDEFSPQLLLDGFEGAAKYLKRLVEVAPEIKYPVFAFNFLTPAGSSIFHPHMQVLVRDRPFYLTELMLKKSQAYYQENKSSFWSDLVAAEKDANERYLFESGGVEWLVPFAPLRGLNEVQAVVRGKSHLLELSKNEWMGLAEGICRVLWFYKAQGYGSFNIVLVSGPMGANLEGFDVNLRMINRAGIQQGCFTDAWAAPYLLWDGEAVEEPEKLAQKIQTFLKTTPQQ
ncbi:MAG: hypothetical protein NWF04_08795 [Candidatus Bathyarchaeota archaeon]|nr:hypothetical protein [Candidatus Bathyarchaeota archaeon]